MNIQANTVVSYFDIGEDNICVKASILTGKEEVFVNDIIVSEKRSLRFKSTHTFDLQSHPMVVKTRLQSWLKGPIVIELLRDGTVIDSDEWSLSRIKAHQKKIASQHPLWKRITVTFGVGFAFAVLGYFVGYSLTSALVS